MEDTQSDFVESSNFHTGLIDRKMDRLCGSEDKHKEKEIKSDGGFFRVTFKSNDVYDAIGFKAQYYFTTYQGELGTNIVFNVGIRINACC